MSEFNETGVMHAESSSLLLPENPFGAMELSEGELDGVNGGHPALAIAACLGLSFGIAAVGLGIAYGAYLLLR